MSLTSLALKNTESATPLSAVDLIQNLVNFRGRTEFRVNVPALPRKRGSEIGAA
jgi:hypothetical protein